MRAIRNKPVRKNRFDEHSDTTFWKDYSIVGILASAAAWLLLAMISELWTVANGMVDWMLGVTR